MARQRLADQLGGSLQTGQSHIHMQINQEEQLGSEIDCAIQGSSMGEKSLKASD